MYRLQYFDNVNKLGLSYAIVEKLSHTHSNTIVENLDSSNVNKLGHSHTYFLNYVHPISYMEIISHFQAVVYPKQISQQLHEVRGIPFPRKENNEVGFRMLKWKNSDSQCGNYKNLLSHFLDKNFISFEKVS